MDPFRFTKLYGPLFFEGPKTESFSHFILCRLWFVKKRNISYQKNSGLKVPSTTQYFFREIHDFLGHPANLHHAFLHALWLKLCMTQITAKVTREKPKKISQSSQFSRPPRTEHKYTSVIEHPVRVL